VALEWQKRCKRADTDIAERRQWWTRCKRYYIEESNIRYGHKRVEDKRNEKEEKPNYPIVYRIMIKRDERDKRFDILAKRKTKHAAVEALEYYVEHGKLPPKKPTKAKKHQKTKRRQKKAKATNDSSNT
jgi:hypothetical protein